MEQNILGAPICLLNRYLILLSILIHIRYLDIVVISGAITLKLFNEPSSKKNTFRFSKISYCLAIASLFFSIMSTKAKTHQYLYFR